MKICMYGAARDQIADIYKESAGAFGRSLARRKHVMVFGGGAKGVMGAAAAGAAAEGGSIVAVAPGDKNFDEEDFGLCSHFIRTGTLAERKAIFTALADAFVVMPGGIGTFDEFFDLISVKRLGDWTSGGGAELSPEAKSAWEEAHGDQPLLTLSPLHISQKPIAIYNVNGYYDLLENLLEDAIRQAFAGEWTRDLYTFCRTEAELWRALEGFPEECCDGSEMTDEEFSSWQTGSEKGFWKTFLEEQKNR